ncbi:MAG: HAMP domain-containing histidine kinase [Anaerolineales bacterium]|nr:HAMP domain-containing histidine kinase [Anaerolineales bacterium]
MSIRLRFSLLYTVILALTLTFFGVALYLIQAQSTLDSIQHDLQTNATRLAEATLRSHPPIGGFPQPAGNRPPLPFGEFSNEQEFQAFPEREIARVLDPTGTLVASPFGRAGDELPLSAEGLAALQAGQAWWQTEDVAGEPTLIYSQPVMTQGALNSIVQVARPLTERNRTLQSLVTTVLLAGALITSIAFGIGWVFSGITLAPIQRITKTAQSIGDERDFSHRVSYQGPQDEVGQLANTFNQMLSRLQSAFEKVEHSLQMQRDFVADVSHELRTPLTTLRGNLALLSRTPMSAEERTDILNDMAEEGDRLIRLVNELLLLAQADAGRQLTQEHLNISEILEEVLRQTQVLDPGQRISASTSETLSLVGDRDALKQIILIALDNAIKHSSGRIQVVAQRAGDWLEIRVQDEGSGIAADKLQHVFDRFYRSEDSTAGMGLGLSIAQTLVERMDGTIQMQSELGKGSILIVRFPAAQ